MDDMMNIEIIQEYQIRENMNVAEKTLQRTRKDAHVLGRI